MLAAAVLAGALVLGGGSPAASLASGPSMAAADAAALRLGDDCAVSRLGCEAWVARYDAFGALDDAGAVALSPDGAAVFVAGHSNSPQGYDGAVLAYDALSGAERWVVRLDGPDHGFDEATALQVSGDGATLFVAGYSQSRDTGDDGFIAALRATDGAVRWVTRYDGPAHAADFFLALAVSPDGERLFATGPSSGIGTGYDFALVALDAGNGTIAWAARHDGPGHGNEFAHDLAVRPHGAGGAIVVAVGSSHGVDGATDALVVAVDAATGAERWAHRAGAAAPDEARAVALDGDGRTAFVAGSLGVEAPEGKAMLLALDVATGARRWAHVVEEPGAGRGVDVATAPGTGAVFLAASVRGREAGSAIGTLALDAASGDLRWKTVHEGPVPMGKDEPMALSPSADGARVFVTGWSLGWLPVGVHVPAAGLGAGAAMDMVTLAHDARDGALAWEARYQGPGNANDQGRGLAVSPDGARLFVAGYSDGGATNFDYATLAYDLAALG